EFSGDGVEIVNPAPAVARRVAQVLEGKMKMNEDGSVGKKIKGHFVTTGDNLSVLERMVREMAGGLSEDFVFEKREIF
ncbi:MAG: hypothetical protein IKW15_01730, partial [Bacteroidales bacterium]|nr:hypothetical protein [Bacteroidales bacterium]